MIIKRGSVIWAYLEGKGSEQKGLRPCVVVQNNKGNHFSRTTIVVPLTKKNNKNGALPTHVVVPGEALGKNLNDSVALTEQIKVIDKTRIMSVGNLLPKHIMDQINKRLLVSLELSHT